MNKKTFKNILLFVFLIIFVTETIFISYLFYDNKQKTIKINEWEDKKFEKLNYVQNIEINNKNAEIDQIRSVQKQPKQLNEIKVSGWIPDWDYSDGFESLKKFKDTFSSISPFWFEINKDGSLKSLARSNDLDTINFTKNNNIDLIPSITSFDATTLNSVLSTEENTQRHIQSIISQVKNNNYDGIDLDYESLYLRDKEKFLSFLQKLSIEMIKIDKKLVFTILPKWGETDVVYLGFPETRKSFDYKKIADMVDEFRIMTYEYSGKNNRYYGPVGPISWLEDVLRYAIHAGVPREKIMLGVHTYSYDYKKRERMPQINYYPVLAHHFDGETGLAYYNNIIDRLIRERDVKISFDNEWGEAIGEYTDDNGNQRILVFPDQKAINLRKQLAADYGIKGVAYWRIGDEGSLKY